MAVAGRRTVVRDVCRGRAAEQDCSLDKSARSNGLPPRRARQCQTRRWANGEFAEIYHGHCVTLLAVETHVPALPGRAARLRTRAPGGRTYRSFHKREPSVSRRFAFSSSLRFLCGCFFASKASAAASSEALRCFSASRRSHSVLCLYPKIKSFSEFRPYTQNPKS